MDDAPRAEVEVCSCDVDLLSGHGFSRNDLYQVRVCVCVFGFVSVGVTTPYQTLHSELVNFFTKPDI